MRRFWSAVVVLYACNGLNAEPLKLDYIFPAGCRRGSSCEVEVGGSWSDNALSPGISGTGVDTFYKDAVYTYVPEKTAAKNAKNPRYRKTALRGHSLLNMNIAPMAETGVQELYIDCRREISNPVKFEISDYEEIVAPATNRRAGVKLALNALPVCLNGRILSGKPDCYQFKAKDGAKIVAYFRAEVMTPGGFVPDLQIQDAAGAAVTNGVTLYHRASTPVLVFEVSLAGDYTLRVGDPAGKGGRAAVYRIVFGELPLITDFSPRCLTKGSSENVRLQGVNLKQTRVRLFSGGKDTAMCMQTIAGKAFVLPGLHFDLKDEQIVNQVESNHTAGQAQPLQLPVVVQGISKLGVTTSEFYSFEAVAGQELYIDVDCGSCEPTTVTVRDGAGAVVASQVHPELSAVGRLIQGRGLSLPLVCAAAGRYIIELCFEARDTLEPIIYTLRVGAAVPDFEVWMSPVAINIPRHGSQLIQLYVRRIHGYAAPLSVTAAFPPLGVISTGGAVAAGAESGWITLWCDGHRFPKTAFYQELVAEAEINGVMRRRVVRPLMMMGTGADQSTHQAVVFEKSPVRVNFHQSGILVDWGQKSPLALSANKAREISLTAKLVTGDLVEDYDYIVLAPEKGVRIKNKIASKAPDTLRLSLILTADGSFKAGDGTDLIIGIVKKKKDATSLVAATQALRLICK
ncbi:MAG: hypothetical protein WC340_13115 [Kiritimatiellia bacterium]